MTTPDIDLNLAHARATAATLIAAGCRHLVLSPGSRSTPLLLALTERPELTTHVVLDERDAAFFALGLARASHTPALLLSTSGSAPAHYTPAILEAHHSRVPLIVLSADRPPELHHCGAPQATPQHNLFAHHTRASLTLPTPHPTHTLHATRNLTAHAAHLATGSPPGPVHINAPFRKPLWLPDAAPAPPTPRPTRTLSPSRHLDTDALRPLLDRLLSTPRGLLACGPRPVDHDEAAFAHALTRLAHTLGWPILADITAGLRFGDHPKDLLIHHADALLRHDPTAHSLAPDHILRFGQIPTSKPITQHLTRHGADRTTLVDAHLALRDPTHHATELIHAHPTELLHALCDLAIGHTPADPDWATRWTHANQATERALAPLLEEPDWEGAVAHSTARALRPGAALHLASSMPIRDMDAFAAPRSEPLRVFSSRGVNGIDGTLATAAGEALEHDGGPLTVVTGDLAFLHNASGLQLAVRASAERPITVVLVDNGGGGIFSFLPIHQHERAFEPLFITPQDAHIPSLCDAYHAEHRPTPPEALPDALRDAQARERGCTVLHVTIDRARNVARHQEATSRVQRALGSAS